jgi:alpha-galactosidase
MQKPLQNGALTVRFPPTHTLNYPDPGNTHHTDLKYDNCGVPSNWTDKYTDCVPDGSGNFPNGTCPDLDNSAPKGYDWTTSKTFTRYTTMRDALLATNRTIFYSLCDWGQADVNTWGNETGNSWRMSGDITGGSFTFILSC